MTTIKLGDKAVRDTAAVDQGNVRLGDLAPIFVRPTQAGDKAIRDSATVDQGKVKLGDMAPAFRAGQCRARTRQSEARGHGPVPRRRQGP